MELLAPSNMRIFTEQEFVEYSSRGIVAGTIHVDDFNAEFVFGNCKIEDTGGHIRITAKGHKLGGSPCLIEVNVSPQFDSRNIESVCSKHGTRACPAVMALMYLTTKEDLDDFDKDISDASCRGL